MTPLEIVIFGATLFLALVALSQWKRRRIATRLNRGLHSYVSADTASNCPACDPVSV
jgi:hypothetical protein